jgi:hypothetical protein
MEISAGSGVSQSLSSWYRSFLEVETSDPLKSRHFCSHGYSTLCGAKRKLFGGHVSIQPRLCRNRVIRRQQCQHELWSRASSVPSLFSSTMQLRMPIALPRPQRRRRLSSGRARCEPRRGDARPEGFAAETLRQSGLWDQSFFGRPVAQRAGRCLYFLVLTWLHEQSGEG